MKPHAELAAERYEDQRRRVEAGEADGIPMAGGELFVPAGYNVAAGRYRTPEEEAAVYPPERVAEWSEENMEAKD